jgi:hypothetical protein
MHHDSRRHPEVGESAAPQSLLLGTHMEVQYINVGVWNLGLGVKTLTSPDMITTTIDTASCYFALSGGWGHCPPLHVNAFKKKNGNSVIPPTT